MKLINEEKNQVRSTYLFKICSQFYNRTSYFVIKNINKVLKKKAIFNLSSDFSILSDFIDDRKNLT